MDIRLLRRGRFALLALAVVTGLSLPGIVAAQQLETPTSAGPVAILDTPVFRIPFTGKPPTIDGKMEPKEWEDASALSCFWYDRYSAHFLFLAPHQTQLEVYGAYDKENLYIAYSSPVYPQSSWLKALGRYPDVVYHPQYGLQWDDHTELEIRPYNDVVKGFRMGLFKWYCNPIGTIADWHWSPDAAGMGKIWQSKAQSATQVTDTRWTIEFAIPLKAMIHEGYDTKDDNGRPIVRIPPPDGTVYRVWFTRGIGGLGPFFNAYDNHMWNTTKTKMILDSQAPSFQINDLGEIMNDTIDVDLTVKNPTEKSQTLRIGFFVESAEGTVYSSYDDEALTNGLVELVPGEVRKLKLSKKFPGITLNGNTLWFDVRAAGNPAKPLFQTRLVDFHHMDGGAYNKGEGVTASFRWERVDVIERMRPPRKAFDWWWTHSDYENRCSVVVDKGIYGGSDEAKTAVEAKIAVREDTEDAKLVAEETVPFIGAHACSVFDLPELRKGHYKATVLLFDENKRIVGEAEPPAFYVGGEYAWVKNQVGRSDTVWEPFVPLQGDDNTVETLKHVIDVDATGLPRQITIKPEVTDVPLEYRKDLAKAPKDVLVRHGRGPQLRKPLRLVAVVEGKRIEAQAIEPAKPVRKWKSEREYASKVKIGPLDANLTVRYDLDGSMRVDMNWGPAGSQAVEIDALELVGDFAGHYDLVVTATQGGGMSGTDRSNCYLPAGTGEVWSSIDVPLPEMFYSRLIPWFLVGSGNRAFTWICDSDRGLMLDRESAMITLHRQKPGELTARIRLVNHPVAVRGRRDATFSILTHPSKPKPENHRQIGWFLKGGTWAGRWGPMIIPGEEAESSRGGKGADWADTEPPWDRWYQLRGLMPFIESVRKNEHRGDITGRSMEMETEWQVKRIHGDGEEVWETKKRWGCVGYFGKALEDFFVFHFGRNISIARRNGWWWDETWCPKRSMNLAAGEAYLRDPETIRDRELPWQDGFLTHNMRRMFKRLARVFKESGVPQRQYLWANTSASTFEAYAWDTGLVEGASSDHSSFELDNLVVFPLAQWRFNSMGHTGLVARLMPKNVSQPGDDKRLTRGMLGRCLAHDIATQCYGPHGYIEHPEQVVRVIVRMKEFGYWKTDDATEFVPYWLARDAVTIGEDLNQSNAPRVYASAYRRPLTDESGKAVGTQTMIVLVNESDEAVRVPLKVTDPGRLFGGPNTLTEADAVAGAQGPAERSKQLTEALKKWQTDKPVLSDAEGKGFVAQAATDGKTETYGPVVVGKRNFRLLYAQSRSDR